MNYVLTTFLFDLNASLDRPQIFQFYYASKETIKTVLTVFLPYFWLKKCSGYSKNQRGSKPADLTRGMPY